MTLEKREKLPPGCFYTNGPDPSDLMVFTRTGHDVGTPDLAWAWFEEATGLSQETYEAMERDHRTMEALRAREEPCQIRLCPTSTVPWTFRIQDAGPSGLTTVWRATAKGSDPADVILTALGEGGR